MARSPTPIPASRRVLLSIRYEFYDGSRCEIGVVKAGQRYDFCDAPYPITVHGVIIHGGEAAVFTGTKAELSRLGKLFLAEVAALPDDRIDGTAQPVMELRKQE